MCSCLFSMSLSPSHLSFKVLSFHFISVIFNLWLYFIVIWSNLSKIEKGWLVGEEGMEVLWQSTGVQEKFWLQKWLLSRLNYFGINKKFVPYQKRRGQCERRFHFIFPFTPFLIGDSGSSLISPSLPANNCFLAWGLFSCCAELYYFAKMR